MNQTISLPVPAAYSLDSYLQTVNRYPMLTLEEEQRLARAWHDEQDVEAARQLVVSHLRVVASVARHYLGYGLPQADLIQEGNVGLMKAVKRFDPDRGVRLVSFALHWIRAEIHEYILKNWRLVKVATTKAQRKLFFNLRSLEVVAQRPDVQGGWIFMAHELNVSRKDVLEMETRMSAGDIPSIRQWTTARKATARWLFWRARTKIRRSCWSASRPNACAIPVCWATALEKSDERSRHHQGALADRSEAATLHHELAAEYGISAERIRQIEARALQKMRALIPACKIFPVSGTTNARFAGVVVGGFGHQKNAAIKTEKMLIHDQTISATTTTMGKP
jgi:RNA polymerase sigma-32 factor